MLERLYELIVLCGSKGVLAGYLICYFVWSASLMSHNYLLYRHSLMSVDYFRPLHCGGIVDRDPPDTRVILYSRPAVCKCTDHVRNAIYDQFRTQAVIRAARSCVVSSLTMSGYLILVRPCLFVFETVHAVHCLVTIHREISTVCAHIKLLVWDLNGLCTHQAEISSVYAHIKLFVYQSSGNINLCSTLLREVWLAQCTVACNLNICLTIHNDALTTSSGSLDLTTCWINPDAWIWP